MTVRSVVLTFVASVVAAAVGWFGGGALRDAISPSYDTAVAVIEAPEGLQTATPSPTPTVEATEEPTPTPTPSPTEEVTPTPEPTPPPVPTVFQTEEPTEDPFDD